MTLEIGSRLGPYEIQAVIGEGGMGQVYQATDTKLNRQVALKILPEAFASDPDRLVRSQREAHGWCQGEKCGEDDGIVAQPVSRGDATLMDGVCTSDIRKATAEKALTRAGGKR